MSLISDNGSNFKTPELRRLKKTIKTELWRSKSFEDIIEGTDNFPFAKYNIRRTSNSVTQLKCDKTQTKKQVPKPPKILSDIRIRPPILSSVNHNKTDISLKVDVDKASPKTTTSRNIVYIYKPDLQSKKKYDVTKQPLLKKQTKTGLWRSKSFDDTNLVCPVKCYKTESEKQVSYPTKILNNKRIKHNTTVNYNKFSISPKVDIKRASPETKTSTNQIYYLSQKPQIISPKQKIKYEVNQHKKIPDGDSKSKLILLQAQYTMLKEEYMIDKQYFEDAEIDYQSKIFDLVESESELKNRVDELMVENICLMDECESQRTELDSLKQELSIVENKYIRFYDETKNLSTNFDQIMKIFDYDNCMLDIQDV